MIAYRHSEYLKGERQPMLKVIGTVWFDETQAYEFGAETVDYAKTNLPYIPQKDKANALNDFWNDLKINPMNLTIQDFSLQELLIRVEPLLNDNFTSILPKLELMAPHKKIDTSPIYVPPKRDNIEARIWLNNLAFDL